MAERFSVQNSCFVMMPFAEEFDGTHQVIKDAVRECGLDCVRADEIQRPGEIVKQVYAGIDSAAVCIADISGHNPNVLAEVGYAQAKVKPVILIYRGKRSSLPFNISHLRVIAYTATSEGHDALKGALIENFRAALGSPKGVLKEMLVPASLGSAERPDDQFVVAASPLGYREAVRTGGGFTKLRTTSADHVGIRGLIQAFGIIYGLERLPDLVNPADYVDDAAKRGAHLYCIGRPKANRWTGLLLKEFYAHWTPRLEFKADPKSTDLRNIRVMVEKGGVLYHPPGFEDGNRYLRDFGFVMRGPHPFEPRFMFMVVGGRSGLGTQAACLAATIPENVERIKVLVGEQAAKRGLDFDINDHTQAFWAVAHMRSGGEQEQYQAVLESLEIPWAEPFQARRSS